MSHLMHYENKDFLANPLKYKLFKTATTRVNFFGENGEDVLKGTVVGLEFLGVKRNQLYKRDEPIYKLTTGHIVYANSLHEFSL